jgi:transcriptional antiterminator RfaH
MRQRRIPRLEGMSIHLDFWQKTSWFAVQTKAHREPLAATGVTRLALEVFLPQLREERSFGRGIRRVTKALFPGYFFTRFCPLESLDAVRYSPGVLRVVGSGRFPSAVAPEIVCSIQKRVYPDGFLRLEARGFQPGDKVTVEQGPFQGWMGEVQREQDGGKRVMILLEAIRQAQLSVEKCWLSTQH